MILAQARLIDLPGTTDAGELSDQIDDQVSRSRPIPTSSARAHRSRGAAHIPAEEVAVPGRFARLGQLRIQASRRRGLAEGAHRQRRGSSSICSARRPTSANCSSAARKASIASTASAARIEFLYKCVGRGTRGLATLEKGDDLNMVGPLGVGFRLDPAWRHIVVLGRGVGIATLGPISQLARDNDVGVTAILSAREHGLRHGRYVFPRGRRRRQRARHRRHRARSRTSRQSSTA